MCLSNLQGDNFLCFNGSFQYWVDVKFIMLSTFLFNLCACAEKACDAAEVAIKNVTLTVSVVATGLVLEMYISNLKLTI